MILDITFRINIILILVVPILGSIDSEVIVKLEFDLVKISEASSYPHMNDQLNSHFVYLHFVFISEVYLEILSGFYFMKYFCFKFFVQADFCCFIHI
jgi:hypothetical protein